MVVVYLENLEVMVVDLKKEKMEMVMGLGGRDGEIEEGNKRR